MYFRRMQLREKLVHRQGCSEKSRFPPRLRSHWLQQSARTWRRAWGEKGLTRKPVQPCSPTGFALSHQPLLQRWRPCTLLHLLLRWSLLGNYLWLPTSHRSWLLDACGLFPPKQPRALPACAYNTSGKLASQDAVTMLWRTWPPWSTCWSKAVLLQVSLRCWLALAWSPCPSPMAVCAPSPLVSFSVVWLANASWAWFAVRLDRFFGQRKLAWGSRAVLRKRCTLFGLGPRGTALLLRRPWSNWTSPMPSIVSTVKSLCEQLPPTSPL